MNAINDLQTILNPQSWKIHRDVSIMMRLPMNRRL